VQFVLIAALLAQTPTTLMKPPFKYVLGFDRVGPFYLHMYLGKDFHIDPDAITGAKMAEEDNPATSTDDHILTLFGTNCSTSQIVYNVKLIEPRLFPMPGRDTVKLKHPRGISCNSRGDVYVADTDNDRVLRLKYAGTFLTFVYALKADLSRPRDVSLDSRGFVYVADSGNNRVVVFDTLGNEVAQWPGFEGPNAIAVLDAGADYNEYGLDAALVLDREGTRVNQASLSGQVVRQTDMRRLGLDEARFAYCAFDRHGNTYVTDQVNSQVHMFDRGLKYIVSFGRQGNEGSAFDAPRGIAIWRRFGQVFITEAGGGQYYWLGLDAYLLGFYPEEFTSAEPGTTIGLYITEQASISVDITDAQGNLVRQLVDPHDQHPGEVLLVWDGRDDKGILVAEGEYKVSITCRPVYSAQKRLLKKELAGTVRRIAG
jgi:hypothetical protein